MTTPILEHDECWLDVTVLYAGLQVPQPIHLTPDFEKILKIEEKPRPTP